MTLSGSPFVALSSELCAGISAELSLASYFGGLFMDNETRLTQLEEDLNLVYDDLDKRITNLEAKQSDNIAIFGIVVSIVIGVTQIIIALVK